jgi:hypothetical protein
MATTLLFIYLMLSGLDAWFSSSQPGQTSSGSAEGESEFGSAWDPNG